MNAKQIYELKPKRASSEDYDIANIIENYIEEFVGCIINFSNVKNTEIKYYVDYNCSDEDGNFKIFSLWYRENPFIIIQERGNSSRRFITNKKSFL